MEMVSSAPTTKQRRKFERIETSNMNNQDTSSINHVSDVDIGKLSKCAHGEVQMLADCCKESIKKFFLRKKNEDQRRISDLITHSSIWENYLKMNKTLLHVIYATPLVISSVAFSILYAIYVYNTKSPERLNVVYISEIALEYPLSSFFTLAVNTISVFVAVAFILRYLVLCQYLRDYGEEQMKKIWANITFWSGILLVFGIVMIANFPANEVINTYLHFMGVMIFFVASMIMCLTQTLISYYTINVLSDRRIYYLQVTMSIIILTSGVTTFIAGIMSWNQFIGDDYRKWQPSDGGWTNHVISVISEWIFVYSCNLYIVTLGVKLQPLMFHMPIIKIKYMTAKEKMES